MFGKKFLRGRAWCWAMTVCRWPRRARLPGRAHGVPAAALREWAGAPRRHKYAGKAGVIKAPKGRARHKLAAIDLASWYRETALPAASPNRTQGSVDRYWVQP
ncbi:hypothetical protein F5144DRAFT_616045 [Chaetomium tenue]|uniref:Uncharacterized protein n=1 Tax=Chaetomium tenue TaxID=1854479 RepID=A0ACB7NXB6_9PEZI|nr:hypothetical protein F5144DRAFT_616045 [Chaetomium globosum]